MSPRVIVFQDKEQYLMLNLFLPRRQMRIISAEDFSFLALCCGNHTMSEMEEKLGLGRQSIEDKILVWETLAPGMFVKNAQEEEKHRLSHEARRLLRTFEAAKKLSSAPDLNHYHKNVISDAQEQFEETETTLSHMYHEPNEALGNLSYGAAFCEKWLQQLNAVRPLKILEIGCGVGFFARDFLDQLKNSRPELYSQVSYTMLDLSPALQKSQKEMCARHSSHVNFILDNVLEHDFSPEKFDLVVANEMIADLPVEVARRDFTDAKNLAEKLILHYELDRSEAPPLYLVNTGAIQLVEKVTKLLSEDGIAVLTEYGSLKHFPEAAKLGEHNEYSIRFDDLKRVAQKLNHSSTIKTVGEYLSFKETVEVMHADSYGMLCNFLLPYLGRTRLQRRPYDRKLIEAELGDVWPKIHNLNFHPLKEAKDVLNPFRFLALVLKA